MLFRSEKRANPVSLRLRRRGRGLSPPPSAVSAAGGWGSSGSWLCGVYRVARCPAGGALEVEAMPGWSGVLLVPLLCAVVFWVGGAGPVSFGARGFSDLSRPCPQRAGGEVTLSSARFGVPVLRPGRRCAVVSSCGSAGLVGWCALEEGWCCFAALCSLAGRGGEGRYGGGGWRCGEAEAAGLWAVLVRELAASLEVVRRRAQIGRAHV